MTLDASVEGLRERLREAERVIRALEIERDALRAAQGRPRLPASEEALGRWAREHDYRALVDSMDDMLAVTDLDGRVLFVNRAVQRFGMAPEDLLGHRFGSNVHIDDLPACEAAWERASTGERTVTELRLITASGKTCFLRLTCSPLWERGEVAGVVWVASDRTRQHEVEEQLRHAQKMDAIGRLAGGVAHDFGNLLRVIETYTGLAMGRLAHGDPIRADLDDVRKACERAAEVTKQLLLFSRRRASRPDVLDLSALAEGMASVLRPLLGGNIKVRSVRGRGSSAVFADAGQMEQVIMNLALNARDAMPHGGTLELAIRDAVLDDDAALSLGAQPGPYVLLMVTDSGSGMDESTLSHLFEPFFTTKPPGKGTGLGLATVYGIVKQNGGGIRVESEPGKGTRFEIALPRAMIPVTERPRGPTGGE